MKRIIFLLLACAYNTIHSHNANGGLYQESSKNREDSVSRSILHAINSREYIEHFFPHNLTHVLELVEHGTRTNQPHYYVRSVFKVFNDILKRTEFINACAFEHLLSKFPISLNPFFIPYKAQQLLRHINVVSLDLYDRFNESINAFLYNKFSAEWDLFRKSPESFLNSVAHAVTDIAKEEIEMEALRQSIMQFIELGISKLVWPLEDQDQIWNSVKNIANRLADLVEYNIISDVYELDSVYRTLVHRFCYFINITGDQLNDVFYENIKQDILNKDLLLFSLENQEPLLESRASCLHRVIEQNKPTAH